MSIDNARRLLQQALVELDTVDVPGISVHAGQSLQAAHDAAKDGDTITVDPGTYVGPLVSTKSLLWRPWAVVPQGRPTKVTSPVTVISAGATLVNHAAHASFTGFEFSSSDPSQTIVSDDGVGLALDRVAILGDPVKGQHRGLIVNGQNTTLRQCYIDDCFLPARDSQAIIGWDGTKDLVIDDCYLAGGAETVMFGGADSSSVDRIPDGITITNSMLTKNPNWYALGAQIKNAFELKAARNVVVRDSVLKFAGIAEGMGGHVIVLTVRNQSGKAPWTTISNVLIERCLCRFGGGCVSFLGSDTDAGHPSATMNGVTLRNVAFTDIDPHGPWKGRGRGFEFAAAPQGVVLDGITVKAANMGAMLYLTAPAPVGLRLNNLALAPATYPIKIDAGGQGAAALQAFAKDAVITLTPTDVGAVGYPVDLT